MGSYRPLHAAVELTQGQGGGSVLASVGASWAAQLSQCPDRRASVARGSVCFVAPTAHPPPASRRATTNLCRRPSQVADGLDVQSVSSVAWSCRAGGMIRPSEEGAVRPGGRRGVTDESHHDQRVASAPLPMRRTACVPRAPSARNGRSSGDDPRPLDVRSCPAPTYVDANSQPCPPGPRSPARIRPGPRTKEAASVS